MKKSILAILLALVMVASLLPATALADGTIFEVSTQKALENVLARAKDGDTVRLVDDISIVVKDTGAKKLAPMLYIRSNITLDLNEHKLSYDQTDLEDSLVCTPCLISIDGADVIITGNGTIDAEAKNNNAYGINIVNNGSLTVENGNFYGAITAIQVESGTLNIYGGTFQLAKTVSEAAPGYANYVINAIDKYYKKGDAAIAITGGTFIGFNPSANPEGTGTSYVVGDCTVNETTGDFVISAPTAQTDNHVAEVNGMYFTSLNNAIAAANRGATVKLLKGFTEANVVIPKVSDITLDLNGKIFNAGENLISKGNLTIIDSTVTSEPTVSADYETVTYNSGKIEVTKTVFATSGGTVTLKSGSIISKTNIGVYAEGDITGTTTISSTFNIEGGYVLAQEFAASAQGKGAMLNISGGVLVAKDNAVVAGNGTVTSKKNLGGTTININGGTMIGHITTDGYIACGVYHPQQGTLNISGGTIYADGGVGVLMRAGDANITGGSIIATGNTSGQVGDSTIIQNCYGIVYDETSNYPGMTDADIVTVSGNASVKADAGSEAVYVMQSETATAKRVTVKGGSFNHSVADYVDASLNYEVNNSGTYTYYNDFETALANAQPGAQIKDLNAAPDAAMYSLVVDPANGGKVTSISVSSGTKYTLPTVSKSGYAFLGWACSDGKTYSALQEVTITANTTFTASWVRHPDTPYVPEPEEPEEPEVPAFPFYDVSSSAWYYTAVKYVYENKLMDGVDTYVFAPNDTLTRAMVWTIIARMSGVDTTGGNTWYAKAQEWVITNGISDGENPTAAITREQLVTMLYRYAQIKGYDVSVGENTNILSYVDATSISEYAMSAFQWACGSGLTEGDENGALTPLATATRAQAAAMIMRFCQSVK